ncbi:MAG TPA: preprotein translocase subunit YajC [Desulfovibrio sp.]|jgi:preprotein translocase subunit YajC|uniref:preprotein translocase subunit YajC n=1 Tax=Desulfovibrio TaxID=872 RepID=UPI000422D4A6|nr:MULTISPECIES: preprotein translocase subunit YajC [Desulfovibrio]MDY0306684.1 preprotein translocase subunit YajC [Desulfovibrionaceae bacterium]HMM38122.1 preprotein translocase subunit YajC [Desulfovibrio sp.]
MFFDSIAHAMGSTGGAGAEGGNPITAFLPLILMFAIFYFLLIRPQQKKAKQHKEMLAGIRKGDKVLTAGGLEGAVLDVDGDSLTVEIAQGVTVKVNRNYVAGLMNPVRKADKEEK